MAAGIQVVIDQRAIARADARLAKYEGRALMVRAQRAYLEGARLMVTPLRQAAPRGVTGKLRSSITARSNRVRMGEVAAATVGVRRRVAPHGHLVTGGTKPHSLAAQRPGKHKVSYIPIGNAVATGPRMGRFVTNTNLRSPGSKAQPFVSGVTDRMASSVQSFIAQRVLDIGVTDSIVSLG